MPKRKYQEALGATTAAAGKEEDAPPERAALDGCGRTVGKDEEVQQPDGGNCGSDGAAPSTSSAVTVTPTTTTTTSGDEDTGQKPAKQKKSVKWSNVTVYLFPRQQGFTCVPSSGGVTLGMTSEHSAVENYTLTEHEMECKKSRMQALQKRQTEACDSDEEMDETEEDIDEDEEDEEDEEEEEEEEGTEEEDYEDVDDACSFPISIPFRQRRNLLREAGCQVDLKEREDCQFIRVSREACGCQCQTVCNPDECSCSLNKIKCQVDRFSYPCGCSRDGCGNATGRVEFNPNRVKAHYMSTVSRLTNSSGGGTDFDNFEASSTVAVTASEEFHYQQHSQQSLHYGGDSSGGGMQSTRTCHMDVVTAYSSHDTFNQAPQCEYACSTISSSSTSTSYQIEPLNVSVSMSAESYSSTVCQPAYDYYHMQPAYEVDNSSMSGISSASGGHQYCNGVATNGYLDSYYTNGGGVADGNGAPSQMISSPTLQYIQPEVPTYQAIPSVSYGSHHPVLLDSHHSYDPSSSSEGSRESSASLDAVSGPTLDFGELIKQSLVETATA
ncbi:putative Cysteine/serine-rich nuclear protein 3 [Hypsibius exemplaris]|uniref:Cysteine/serine-rich nuclear protein 3 n=1 Tax=Hypsibius exemplaris TaxID=2072580 RepID=A0A1W0X1H2_HYPEX|nr:putative Cysteine/serine-rich nuclear protein 3 [Hypsibius exemplaris]